MEMSQQIWKCLNVTLGGGEAWRLTNYENDFRQNE